MLKRQFSYFLLVECMRKRDQEAESYSGGSVKEGEEDGFIQPVQGFQKQAQPTTMSPSLG